MSKLPQLVRWLIVMVVLSPLGSVHLMGAEQYPHGPDSQSQDGIPKGSVTKFTWDQSSVFPGTIRDYWVYVPAQYDEDRASPVMVFQDGANFIRENGDWRVPTVFDNLIHQGKMPVTIGVFINPGHRGVRGEGIPRRRNNRSIEYDTPGNQYATFLLKEILPEVSKIYRLSTQPEDRAICGNSSGGICAFTVAWERPDAFRKVVSHIGSFTNIRGGHIYPALIRKTETKPIRVFLQDGLNDLDNSHGNWPLANKQMEKALRFADYDYRMVWGNGGHSGKHGGSIFPETIKWLWRDFQ
jgi:enterochelin esterase-like enzyme